MMPPIQLKDLATRSMQGMDHWRAQSLLAEAIGLCPTMATLWSNRSKCFEQIHRYDEALSDEPPRASGSGCRSLRTRTP